MRNRIVLLKGYRLALERLAAVQQQVSQPRQCFWRGMEFERLPITQQPGLSEEVDGEHSRYRVGDRPLVE